MKEDRTSNGASHNPQPHPDEDLSEAISDAMPETFAETTDVEGSSQSGYFGATPRDLPGYFHTGTLAGTHGAVMALLEEVVARHRHGDWGDIDESDKQQNLLAIVFGKYILSSYLLPHTGVRIWVITEGDRSLTTVLLPEEYQNPRSWWTPEP